MTPYQSYKERWKGGCGASICSRALQVVHARGSIPADICFIGEAPGDSENSLGRPFAGPAGHLLDQIVAKSGASNFRCAFLNLVGCLPTDEEGNKDGEPSKTDIKLCTPRLVELVRLCRPKLIVRVGRLAERYVTGQEMFEPVDWLEEGYIRFAEITHPAAILKGTNVANRGFMVQRCIIRLAEAIEADQPKVPQYDPGNPDDNIPF